MEIIFEMGIDYLQARGGISRTYNEIIPRICSFKDVNVSVLATQTILQPLPDHPNIRQINFSGFDRFLRPHRIWRRIYKEIAAHSLNNGKNKILHSTYYQSFPHWKGYRVVSVYDMIYEKYANLFCTRYDDRFREHKKREILNADKLICNSETTARELQETYSVDHSKVVSIPLGYSSQLFKLLNKELIPESDIVGFPFFLYVGYRAKYKNFFEVVRAYKSWSGNKEAFLVAVGPPWEEEEINLLVEMGLTRKVLLYDNVDDQTLSYLYNQASAFVYPSLFEGFGIPLLEAMACGCPVIASPISSTYEITADIPIYFNFRNVDSLHHAFDTAMQEGRGSARVQKGLQQVNKYSWDKTAEDTLMVYRSLIS